MADNLRLADRRRAMQAVKGKGTSIERRLFAILAGLHYRGWKKNDRALPGTPDVVFPRERVAIFVDGCFWHGCPTCNRKIPATNRGYWDKKIKRNVVRAAQNSVKLRTDGWTVFRIWEHEINDPDEIKIVEQKIRNLLSKE